MDNNTLNSTNFSNGENKVNKKLMAVLLLILLVSFGGFFTLQKFKKQKTAEVFVVGGTPNVIINPGFEEDLQTKSELVVNGDFEITNPSSSSSPSLSPSPSASASPAGSPNLGPLSSASPSFEPDATPPSCLSINKVCSQNSDCCSQFCDLTNPGKPICKGSELTPGPAVEE